jgi:CheY-like chemotaxis protein
MTSEQTQLRILSVEDEPLNRALLRASIARAPDERLRTAALAEAASLEAARSLLADGAFDIVLLDRRLPDGDGFDLARELSDLPDESRPHVVALTADAIPETRRAAADAGCVAILTKPFRLADLADLVGRLVDSSAPASSTDMRT